MGSLFERITDWIKEGLIEAITGQYTGIFDSVNSQVADVAGQVGQTPQGWNGGVFSMIQNLSETVVIPIAGMILTFVLVYELIQMILEKNNMHDFDTFNIFKWILRPSLPLTCSPTVLRLSWRCSTSPRTWYRRARA